MGVHYARICTTAPGMCSYHYIDAKCS
uniref:Uncharacterized protein n=1 Tax=Arundo donax TaxID=35708 RepID=A0A0A8ZU63_ARUDO